MTRLLLTMYCLLALHVCLTHNSHNSHSKTNKPLHSTSRILPLAMPELSIRP